MIRIVRMIRLPNNYNTKITYTSNLLYYPITLKSLSNILKIFII